LSKIIYKSPQGETREISTNSDIAIPKQKIVTFFDLTKDKLYLYLNKVFETGLIPVLYDKNIKSINSSIKSMDFDSLPNNTAAIFFTSGTTGKPIGVLKSKENITHELDVLKDMFLPYNFEQVIVTVPLVHIYGFLTGVLLPKALDIDVILKEEFIPHELIELGGNKRTLCITNPVFLKALNRLSLKNKYKNITFLSSTGKLEIDIIKSLNKKLDSEIYQIFGSTETGGIAYKINTEELWKPLPSVDIGKNGSNLVVCSPFLSHHAIVNELIEFKSPFITTDIVELVGDSFRLIGRESEIIKVSGKRISILEIESLLEKSKYIDEALVKLGQSIHLYKDEYLDISIVSSLTLEDIRKEVKRVLHYNYTNINIRSTIVLIEQIKKTHMGKKLRG